jgi:hypothetical protein
MENLRCPIHFELIEFQQEKYFSKYDWMQNEGRRGP